MLLNLFFSFAMAAGSGPYSDLKKQCDDSMTWGYRKGGKPSAAVVQKTIENLHGQFSTKKECDNARGEDPEDTSECMKRNTGEKIAGKAYATYYKEILDPNSEEVILQFSDKNRCEDAISKGFHKRAWGKKLMIGAKDSQEQIRFVKDCQEIEAVICEKFAQKASIPPLF